MSNSHQPDANDAFYAALFEGLDSIPAEPMLDDPWVGEDARIAALRDERDGDALMQDWEIAATL